MLKGAEFDPIIKDSNAERGGVYFYHEVQSLILSLKTQIPTEAGFDGLSLQSPKLRGRSQTLISYKSKQLKGWSLILSS